VQSCWPKTRSSKFRLTSYDNTGDAASNKSLSLKRANAVVDYLVSKGVDQNRVSAKGYGSERPIVSNDDESGVVRSIADRDRSCWPR